MAIKFEVGYDRLHSTRMWCWYGTQRTRAHSAPGLLGWPSVARKDMRHSARSCLWFVRRPAVSHPLYLSLSLSLSLTLSHSHSLALSLRPHALTSSSVFVEWPSLASCRPQEAFSFRVGFCSRAASLPRSCPRWGSHKGRRIMGHAVLADTCMIACTHMHMHTLERELGLMSTPSCNEVDLAVHTSTCIHNHAPPPPPKHTHTHTQTYVRVYAGNTFHVNVVGATHAGSASCPPLAAMRWT